VIHIQHYKLKCRRYLHININHTIRINYINSKPLYTIHNFEEEKKMITHLHVQIHISVKPLKTQGHLLVSTPHVHQIRDHHRHKLDVQQRKGKFTKNKHTKIG